MTNKNMIEVQGACKTFRENKVLKEVSLACESGKIYGIVGRNGSGKTVLFKCICGFYKLDKGQIKVNGKIMGKEIDMLTNAGIIIEEPAYLRNFSGYRNLEFLYRIRNKKDKNKLQETMKEVGLEPLSKKRVGKYSLGMRQRLALAQATMENQEILIMDEPMNGLDKDGVADMRRFFEDLKKQGKLILLASHNKDDIDILCDEVFEMDKGELSPIII
ncbi:MAG: ATP-binding cassette domain-containing protein [Oscillospiraceae bacterium]|nr:ATP-binding cassette domain-containing protein [Oscillospiraceae bacterium]